MCGRYVRSSDKQRISEAFHLGKLPADLVLAPSYNVAPQSVQPVVRWNAETGERELTQMRWGLIPSWAKDAKIGFSTINAKAETITTSAAFRGAIKRRRCLIPADAFYEWAKIDAKTKQPYALGLNDGAMLAFAGLWERWKDKASGQPLEAFTIITTDPNDIAAPIHNRMPVIVPPKDYERWLAPAGPSQLPIDHLRPCPAEEMKVWKVGKDVGNVRNDSPGLCEQWE